PFDSLSFPTRRSSVLAVCSLLAAELVGPPEPDVELELGLTFLDVVCTEMLVYHRRFDARRAEYRPSIRGFLENGESRELTAEDRSEEHTSELQAHLKL